MGEPCATHLQCLPSIPRGGSFESTLDTYQWRHRRVLFSSVPEDVTSLDPRVTVWSSCANQDDVVVIFHAPVAEPRSRQRYSKNLFGQHFGIIFYQEVWLVHGGLALPRPSGWAHGVVDEGACMQASKEPKKIPPGAFVKVARSQETTWVMASIIDDLRAGCVTVFSCCLAGAEIPFFSFCFYSRG